MTSNDSNANSNLRINSDLKKALSMAQNEFILSNPGNQKLIG